MPILIQRTMAVVALLVSMTATMASFAQAESLRSDSALRWIPDTASFYSSMLRNREQLDRVLNSRAYQRLMSMPVVQMGVSQITSQLEDEDGRFQEFFSDPENQALVELVKDALSHEVFLYGGDGVSELFGLLVKFSEITNEIQLESIGNGGQTDEDEVQRKIISRIADDINGLDVPRLSIGFRLNDAAQATAQLARLEKLIEQDLDEAPELAKAYKKQMIDGNECLTLTFDTSMIPWDDIDTEDDDEKAKQVQQIRSAVDGKQVVVSLGLRDNYLMLQAGKSVAALRGFGTSAKKLMDHEKMAIVRQYDDKPVTGVAYMNGDFLRAIYQPGRQLDGYAKLATAGLEKSPLDDGMKRDLAKDLDELTSDIKAYYPEMGAVAAVQYLTDDGYEGYSQSWAENLLFDGSKPLEILSNVGGDPLATFSFRSKQTDGRGYKTMAKWLSRFYAYGQKFAEKNLEGEKKAEYDKITARTLPLWQRFDLVTQEDLIPAFGDGQTAFVIDDKLESRQWHLMMPPAAEPLPIFEFAQVCGVTNPEKLKMAFEKYAAVADEMLAYFKEIMQENEKQLAENLDGPAQMLPALIQAAQIPRPTPRETDNGTLYEFSGLAQTGLDPRLAPTAGISKNRFVFSLSPKTAERLLQTTKLEANGPLMDSDTQKLATAMRIDVAGSVGVIRAWVNYGMSTAAELQENEEITAMIPTVDGILEFLQCYRSIESATRVEGDSMISHSQARFQDLPE